MNTVIMKNDVLALLKALNDLPRANGQLPSKFYYALSKNKAKITREAKAIEDTINESIFKKFAEDIHKKDPKTGETVTDSKGNPLKEKRVPPEKVERYQGEVKEFLEDTTEIDIHVVSWKELEKDMPKIQGVDDIYLIFQYICNDGDFDKVVSGDNKKKEDDKPEAKEVKEKETADQPA